MRFCHLINRSFACKAKEGRHTRIININRTRYSNVRFFNGEHICPVRWTGVSTNNWYSSGYELCSYTHRVVLLRATKDPLQLNKRAYATNMTVGWIEGSVESSNSWWSVNISTIALVFLEIGTCIVNDAGRQAAYTQKQRKYTFYMGRSPNYGRNSNISHITNGLNSLHRKPIHG